MAAVSGTCLRFDGTDDVIDFGDNAAADVTAAITFSLWINVEKYQDDGQNPLFYRAGTWDVRLKDGRVWAKIYGGTWADMGVTLAAGTRYFVALSIAEVGSDLVFNLYVDKVLVSTVTRASEAFPAVCADASKVGSDGTYFFQGYISNIMVTSDAMTQAEVNLLYANGWNSNDIGDVDNEIIAIPFNEGTGTSLDNDATADWDGTIAGTELWMGQLGIALDEDPVEIGTEGLQYVGRIKVKRFQWHAATTAAHLAEILDQDGVEIAHFKCAVAHKMETIEGPKDLVNGLNITDLDSGTIYMFTG